MAVTAEQITVKDKATLIAKHGENIDTHSILIRNVGAENIDLGGAAVETGKGFTFLKETTLPVIELDRDSALYGVAAGGKEVTVHVLSF